MNPAPQFSWDDDKALGNERKHGITFQLASTVYSDPLAEIFRNVNHDDVEDRWSVLGMTATGVLVMVVHTYPGGRGEKRVRIRARMTGVDMTEAINEVLRRHVGLPSELPDPAQVADPR